MALAHFRAERGNSSVSEYIIEQRGAKYIEELKTSFDDLAPNAWLDKAVTGNGMTTAALRCARPYVIAMPTVQLIQNKLNWCKRNGVDARGVYGHHASSVLISERAQDIQKFLVTYDQLAEFTHNLTHPKEFCLLVDEAHMLFMAGGYRQRAIRGVEKSLDKYRSFTLGTATVPELSYVQGRLGDLPVYRLNWRANLWKVNSHHCVDQSNFMAMFKMVIDKHLNESSSNAHIFVNSVSIIRKAIKFVERLGYDSDSVRAVVSEKSENKDKLTQGLKGVKAGYVASINDAVKRINFYTSCAFEGCDIEDEGGEVYVFMDERFEYTILSLGITLPQIAGRIRNANNQQLSLYFNCSASAQSRENYEQEIDKRFKDNELLVNTFHQLQSEQEIEHRLRDFQNSQYTYIEGKTPYINWGLKGLLMMNYDNRNDLMSVGRSEKGQKSNRLIFSRANSPVQSVASKLRCSASTKLQERFELILKHKRNRDEVSLSKIPLKDELAERMADAVAKGLIEQSEFERCGWRPSRCNSTLEKVLNGPELRRKIVSKANIQVGEEYALKELRQMLRKACKELGVDYKVKASMVKEFFETKNAKIRLDSGARAASLKIIQSLQE